MSLKYWIIISIILQTILAYHYYWVSGQAAYFYFFLFCICPLTLTLIEKRKKVLWFFMIISFLGHITITLPSVIQLAIIKNEMNRLVATLEQYKRTHGAYPKNIEKGIFKFSSEYIMKSIVRYSTEDEQLTLIFNQPDPSKGYVYTSSGGWRFIDD